MARQDGTQYGSEIIKQNHHSSYIIGVIHVGTEDIKTYFYILFKAMAVSVLL
jgi:uncharacterized protein YbaP (TraB family)